MSVATKPTSTIKPTSGISIAFPDVCKTPMPPAGQVPIPYPNTATTAVKSQQKRMKIAGVKGVTVGHEIAISRDVTLRETQQLKASLNQANARLQGLTTSDPTAWQAAVTDYLVLASALYRTLHPDR